MKLMRIKIEETNQGCKYTEAQKGDRYDIIRKYVAGKDVLNLGCLDIGLNTDLEKAKSRKKDFWLHGYVCRYAKSCVGVDIEENEIKRLNKAGYTGVTGNVEDMDLGRKFDVVIAGQLIEHLDNPGLFLENMKRHLNKGGVVLIDTPNPFFLYKFIQVLIKGSPVVSGEHTCWFDPKTLAHLMTRHGFIIEEIYFTTLHSHNKIHYLVEYCSRAIRRYFSSNFLVVARVMENKQ